jgi:hypothetical protein
MMDGACRAHGRDAKYIQNVSRETLKGLDNLGDQGIDGRIILKLILTDLKRDRVWLRTESSCGLL